MKRPAEPFAADMWRRVRRWLADPKKRAALRRIDKLAGGRGAKVLRVK